MTGHANFADPPSTSRDTPHLAEADLAERWGLSRRTLQRWRQNGTGPSWFRVGRKILYRRDDIEYFERSCRGGGQ
jgi:predicted site-specific integrase-resolvase